ncbi:MAG: TlpA family protein disulfide reductase [Pyrinomonadaceae bacterium]
MLPNISKKIEIASNIAILVVACLLAMVLVKSYLLTGPQKALEPDPIEKGLVKPPAVSLLDIDWKANGQTVLLAISISCRYCTESAPFYRKLAEDQHKTRLIAISSQSVTDSRGYLERLGVRADEIKQFPLDKLGVNGTPTLIIVDSSGVVRSFWTGKLTPEQETAVLGTL